jgi:catechol 2,3-dioxygenase-like lactoylglutathione lyase family enzyme
VVPIFRVGNLPASIDYYVKILGFKLDWHEPGIMASVSRNRCSLMLCEGDQGNPGTWVWIGAEDVESLFAEYKLTGAKVRHPPITPGPTRCRSKIPMATYSASGRNLRRTNLSVNGSTHAAIAG